MAIQDTIREQVTTHPVVLYMKGTPQMPQCGFSMAAVQMLQACGNWPTIPQLYVSGEFVGGSDIMREMYESGELQQLLANQAA